MTRLTNALKDQIVDAAAKKAFGERERLLKERKNQLAMSVYALHYPLPLQEIMTTMQTKMGNRPFSMSDSFYGQSFGGRRQYLHLPQEKPFFAERLDPKYEYLDVDHPLTLEFNAISNADDDLKAEDKKLRSEVRAILNSVTTVKRLLDVWPEVKDLLPNLEKPEVYLPAVQIDKINATIFKTKN